MPLFMNAAVLYGKEDVRIEEAPLPIAGPGEIVVRVEVALTCGTDVKVFRRGYHARMLTPPTLFGHEMAGVVHEVGSGVSNLKPGMRVVALNSAPCGECSWCRRGEENLCEDLLFNNGAYAQYIRVPARIVAKNTLVVPESLRLEHAALTEPLACVVRGFELTAPRPGDCVVVVGAGPIGLMFVHLAKLEGLDVIAVVKHEEQAVKALELGARTVVRTGSGDTIAEVRALTPGGRGADAVFEAVAAPMTWRWAVEMARRGGSVNFFGGCPAGTKVEIDTDRLHYGEISLKGSFHHTPRTCRKAFDLLSSGRFRADAYISGDAPLDDLEDVLRRMMNHSGEMKTVILPHVASSAVSSKTTGPGSFIPASAESGAGARR